MHWRRDPAVRLAERQEQEALDRYERRRGCPVSTIWVDTVEEARRRADAALRLEQKLQAMR